MCPHMYVACRLTDFRSCRCLWTGLLHLLDNDFIDLGADCVIILYLRAIIRVSHHHPEGEAEHQLCRSSCKP